MSEIATRYGVVEIRSHAGADTTLSGRRMRHDHYELTFTGRPYSVLASANWDSPFEVNRDWRLEHVWRHDKRRPTGRNPVPAGLTTKVIVGQSFKAWHAIDEAIREHRKAGGYGQSPEKIGCRS